MEQLPEQESESDSESSTLSVPIFFILVIGEFITQYTYQSIKGIAESGLITDLGFFPYHITYLMNIITFVGIILGILFSLLSDCLISRYRGFVFSQYLFLFTQILYSIVAWDFVGYSNRQYLVKALLYLSSVYPMALGTRSMFLADHITLPSSLCNIRAFLWQVIWARYVATLFFGLFALMKSESVFYKINGISTLIVSFGYSYLLLKMKDSLIRVPVKRNTDAKNDPTEYYEAGNKRYSRSGIVFIIFIPLITYGTLHFSLRKVFQDQLTAFAAGRKKWFTIPHLILDAVFLVSLIPIFEKAIVPFLNKCKHYILNLQLLYISSFILVAAGIVSCLVQYAFELKHIIPQSGTGQLRFYNAYVEEIEIDCSWFSNSLEEFNFLIETVNVIGTDTTEVTIKGDTIDINATIEIVEGESISYVVTPAHILQRLSGYDPLFFPHNYPTSLRRPVVFAFPALPHLVGDFMFFDEENEHLVAHEPIEDPTSRTFLSVKPGIYSLRFEGTSEELNYNHNNTVWVRIRGVYAFMICDVPSLEVYQYEIIHRLPYHYIMTLPGMILKNISLLLSLVSMYHFSFTEPTSNLRSVVFSYIYFTLFVGCGVHLWIQKASHLMLDSVVIAGITGTHFVVSFVFFGMAHWYQKHVSPFKTFDQILQK